ncbi:type III PLP-dependent enzyme [Labedaea rhizosphaerae]|uniref:ornithine decarboxylase n=1 Tax=Labedaea rhizosphaerae TaxID=598644 RepID=A0A4R6SC20_LABRH|nr:type III PLP-dependent enzyme [Labedaea rhizosphaerae]TDP97103.1 ornithine decarboxylase [Labedaea rhizosphaerae]
MPGDPIAAAARLRAYLDRRQPPTPCLAIDLPQVRAAYQDLTAALPSVDLYYAVKANPAPELLGALVALGAGFDVASPGEIDLCLAAGADPSRLSYGNPIKKASDIAHAYTKGVRRFTTDALSDVEHLARFAPGSAVSCRILVDAPASQTPFGRKFGCAPSMAVRVLRAARDLGLDAEGLAFHVGSQHLSPSAWVAGIEQAAAVWHEVGGLRVLNVGGGFPTGYRSPVRALPEFGRAIDDAVARSFDEPPLLVAEPGRALVAEAGVLRSEVVLVTCKSDVDTHRWVYLDIGRYGGLAETELEMIAYPLATAHDGAEDGPVIIAGPTCDGDDVLYQRTPYRLPLALAAGDHVDILGAGAYTASYASVGFNGFPPMSTHCLDAD